MDDRGSIPSREKEIFSSPCVQTGSGAHPASYPIGFGGPFPGDKTIGSVKLATYHLVQRPRMNGAIPPLRHNFYDD
jgi:hypothetical protein